MEIRSRTALRVLAINGTAANPSIGWASDNDGTGTGIYRPSANELGVSINGVLKSLINVLGYRLKQAYLYRDANLGYQTSSVATWVEQPNGEERDWFDLEWSPELGKLVAVSSDGNNRSMTSPDGHNWTMTDLTTLSGWRSVAWSPSLGLFAAVAASGATLVATSPDGTTWTNRTATANVYLNIIWSPDLAMFIAVGEAGAVITSTNGTTWTDRTAAAANDWQGLAWSPELKLLVATGTSGTGNRIMTSPDGITWTSRTSPANIAWNSVTWSPELSLFCGVGDGSGDDTAMTSPDGITWTLRTIGNGTFTMVDWSPELGLFAAVQSLSTVDGVFTSPDGTTWTQRTTNIAGVGMTGAPWRAIKWVSEFGAFVACSDASTGSNRASRIMMSTPLANKPGVFSGVYLNNGTVKAPSGAFTNAPQRGIYNDTANTRTGVSEGLSVLGGQLVLTTLATPDAPTITQKGTAGATSYGYKIVATNGQGATIASAEGTTATGNATLSTTNYNKIEFAPITNATGYKIYRTTGGATQGLIATRGILLDLSAGGLLAYVADTGLAGGGETAETKNTTGTVGRAATGINGLFVDYTNTGTVGNVTMHKPAGRVNIAASGTSFTVTNNLVTAASHILLTFAGAPGNSVSLYAVASAGSFTVNTTAAITNQTAIDFLVINAD